MIQLNYKEFGQGEPVVILHGLFGTLDNWQTIAKALAEHYTVFVIDLRNHGKSPHTEGVFDYPSLAEDIVEFMHSHWIYEARVIGHSMGGKVAMQLALHNPDLVEKLAVIDIAPKNYEGGHEEIFDALFHLDLKTLKDRKEAEAYLMQKLNNEVGTVQFLLKNLSRIPDNEPNGGTFEWKMNLNVLHRDYDNILVFDNGGNTFSKDTVFIRGSKSNYIQNIDFQAITKIFTKAKLETIEGAGHWVHADKPKELLEKLLKFLP